METYYERNREKWKTVYAPRAQAKNGYRESHRIANKASERRRAGLKRERYVTNKVMYLKRLGNACQECGYNTHIEILQFDHIDPTKKTQNFTGLLRHKDLTKVEEEFKNVRLLCPNCHALRTVRDEQLRARRVI
jgi:hypothetical protein